MEDKIYWYWLAALNEFAASGINELIKHFRHPRNLFYASEKAVLSYFSENSKKAERIITLRNISSLEKNYNKMCTGGIHFITSEDEEFPKRLKNIIVPPHWLFYIGRLPEEEKPAIAVVGARVCSNYGREAALNLSHNLSAAGINIISGMASGIDSYAHKGAIRAGLSTYAVLGTGPDICYPQENIELYQMIIKNGGIISEYAPKVCGKSFHFPMRNRLISGLADGIIVVEARKKSGSLITADYGLEQGKDIYAVPGRINDKLSEGCLDLICQGAKPVREAYDIIEDLSIKYDNIIINSSYEEKFERSHQTIDFKSDKADMGYKNIYKNINGRNNADSKPFDELKKIKNILLETEEKIVYANLSLTPKHIETLLEETALPVDNLLTALLQLELNDMIIQPINNYYILNNK